VFFKNIYLYYLNSIVHTHMINISYVNVFPYILLQYL